MKKRTIIFFFRAYNDIDHMTPIIYKLNREIPSIEIGVIIFNINETYENDYRIRYLKNLNIRITHILEYIKIPLVSNDLYIKTTQFIKRFSRFNPIRILINRLFIIPLRKILSKKVADLTPDDFLQIAYNTLPDILVFDQARNKFYEKLCQFSDNHSIVTVAVPHGHNTLANELIWSDSMEIKPRTSEHQFPFYYQYVVFENWIISERYRKMGIVKEEQIHVLGSSRFSDEWMIKIRDILPTSKLPKLPSNILKIVFMLTKPKYNGNPQEVERTIEFLSKFPEIYIIIKPHTRGMKFKMSMPANVQIVDNDYHSPLLIDWADVVLFTMTSVIFDCMKRDIPVLYMKNTQTNTLLSEKFFHSWEVHCRDDLRDFIWAIKNDKTARTYSKEDRDRYCKEMIEPEGKDVLGNYVSFLKGLLL